MDATIFHTSKVSLAKLLLSKDIRDVSEEEVEDVRRRYGVDEEEWRNFKADVLRDYVRAECKVRERRRRTRHNKQQTLYF